MAAGGPVTPLAFHTSAEAARQLEAIPQICILAIGLLFVFSIYLILRVLFTPAGNLSKSSAHVRSASPILIWIAGISLLLAFIAAGFDVYDQLWQVGISGTFDLSQLAVIFMVGLVILGIGFFFRTDRTVGNSIGFLQKTEFCKGDLNVFHDCMTDCPCHAEPVSASMVPHRSVPCSGEMDPETSSG
ncbi:hypothetical protein SAMN02745824_0077 [Parasphingorhabdus marina DSM 22363]|uniref:Uncharacterized protein n=1 Tax=Parasphingorhabdus marina DSM 22363 TaxID=1123272 RepID=A0A1N6CM39_9SPHN|nr:hypothetical protein [Parasphingorhabdus marina]SIN59549.1 hypothetical protein SAMN02745824_0077 [Parasphingorhabdus marina DSM 22363]